MTPAAAKNLRNVANQEMFRRQRYAALTLGAGGTFGPANHRHNLEIARRIEDSGNGEVDVQDLRDQRSAMALGLRQMEQSQADWANQKAAGGGAEVAGGSSKVMSTDIRDNYREGAKIFLDNEKLYRESVRTNEDIAGRIISLPGGGRYQAR
jgi:hypothetical protein